MTPRVWKMSELKSGYHKRGAACPCVSGMHPHCRHTLCAVMPGYGFRGGKIAWIETGHDELGKQRT